MQSELRPDLLIFDCDGVLVDSEPISLAVMLDVVTEAGIDVSEAEGYRHLLGRSIASNADWLRDAKGLELTTEHREALRQRVFERFRAELEPVSGVRDAIEALPIARCVASSSQPDRIALSLSLTGLLDLFEPHLFSASMVTHGKPAPDLFLHAAAKMQVQPADCVVIEDSPAGIAAAKSAGMRVIGFVGGSHAGPADLKTAVASAGPDAIIERMSDLPSLFDVAL
ncbi:MAG: HAD family hydrolase [Pseudomonadota bacterium]|nr:HAD family hydrolase [Pseudomonadota bacterium]